MVAMYPLLSSIVRTVRKAFFMITDLAWQIDPFLKQYVCASNETQARQEMDRIERELTPFIRKSVKILMIKRGILHESGLGVEDIVSEIWLRLMPKLMAVRTCPTNNYVYNIRSYAFKLVSNYCYDIGLYTDRERRYIIDLRSDWEVIQLETISDKSCKMEKTAEMRATIEKLWSEILQLNLEQRTVIILDILRENEYLLLVAHGVASLKSIAEITALPDTVIAHFYNNSPCDCEIANLLNCPKQRVVNLRSSARKRLNRRMQELI